MDLNGADMMGLIQTHVGPGLAGIGGFIHAVAPVGAAGIIGFTTPHPNNLGVGGSHRHTSYGKNLFMREQGLVRNAVIHCFPEMPGSRRQVKRIRLLFIPGIIHKPASLPGGPDLTVMHRF